jgi:NADP-dependent 3-hydroxy acid dehydrogenase YdfG
MNPTSLSDKLVVLITGTSSGIGQACAARLQQHGDRVYRSPPDRFDRLL